MNIQEQIKALETEFNAKIKDLKAQVEQEEQEFPQDGDGFYSISEIGNVESGMIWGGYPVDMDRMAIGNVFETKEQAEFAVEKLKVEAELREFSVPFDYERYNHFIEFYSPDKTIEIESDKLFRNQGTIYFESGEKAVEAVRAVGEERIKKYIFGVE